MWDWLKGKGDKGSKSAQKPDKSAKKLAEKQGMAHSDPGKSYDADRAAMSPTGGVWGGGGWGSRSQIGAATADLADLQGNRDGIWSNEDGKAGETGSFLDRNPLTNRMGRAASVGLTTRDETQELAAYRQGKEAEWGQAATDIDPAMLANPELFAAQKAMMLDHMGRTPDQVTEGFVHATGTVDGQRIAERDLFYQRFRPTEKATGTVVVLSPGFMETGRDFLEQIDLLNKKGLDVVAMDHQWAGYTKGGEQGGIDSGEGVARDVAAMAAFAQTIIDGDYAGTLGARVVMFGNSMGAGPGVLAAATMNDNGMIALDGEQQMPHGVDMVLQSPYLGATPSLLNKVLANLGKISGLADIAMPAAGLPVLTTDETGAQKAAQNAVRSDARAQLSAMNDASGILVKVKTMITDGKGPKGDVSMVHGDEDPLADPEQVRLISELLGEKSVLKMIESRNHVFEQTPGEQNYGVDAVDDMARR